VITVPSATSARVLLPLIRKGSVVVSNGKVIPYEAVEDGTRASFVLHEAGRYEFRQR
jgi:hypothetical protein